MNGPSPSPASEQRAAPFWPDALLLLFLPLLLLLADRSWLASPLFLDPYLYIGYYLNLPGHLQAFPNHYISTRLPALLPGWFAHSLLPPVAASVVLRFGLFYTSLFSLYGLLRLRAGRRPAVLTAALLAGSPFFVGAMGTDYTDAYAIAFLLVALACLQAAVSLARPTVWLAGAGAALAALVFTNLFFALFAGLAGLFFLGIHFEARRYPLPAAIACLLTGFALATAGLMLCSVLLGGPVWFFLPSTSAAVTLARTHESFLHRPWYWLLGASWLVLPVSVALGCVIALLGRRERPSAFLPVSLLALGLTTLLGLEWANLGVIRFWYYATPLLPFVALSLGWLLGPVCRPLPPRHFHALLALAVLLAVAVAACPSQYRPWSFTGPWRFAFPVAVGVVAFFLVARPRPTAVALTGFLLLLGVSQALSRLGFRYEAPWPAVPLGIYDSIREHDRERLDVLCAAVETVRAIQTFDRRAQTPFWYDGTESIGLVYREIACTHFLRWVNENFPATVGPSLNDRPVSTLPQHIALLSQKPDAAEQARAALAGVGFHATPSLQQTIAHGRIRFELIILERQPDGPDPASARTVRAQP